ncbi:MAG TPA: radical SAM family heme chaperone HemW [Oscillospiraceae bacterium]|nr:radical SAM family heme chaperone HemW [Oscillospiraceae bacterium]HPF56636.1 radical SAM family heme chaperone HemW [Clostridiales bacterium]HPK34512.1 radical SAM family heme chaperone HemW [Oscillospiraceae bacterium]HPR74740.1 radical SAM family heme chaperone HemW [Oscillospiraceae bacterium]
MTGLYIHVPFCRSKCHYCDFYSVRPDDGVAESYIQAVLKAAEPYRDEKIDTAYFGGGNPLLLGAHNLCRLLDELCGIFRLKTNSEITLESNPEDVSPEAAKTLFDGGFNRISIGVQSLDDEVLKKLGRRHDAKQAISAVETAYQAGFRHISADLMLSLPDATPEKDKNTAKALCQLPLDHISAYLLKVEQGTLFAGMKLNLPDEDSTADSYLAVCETLEENGFAQYEISNFAKPGGKSRHNLKYWTLEPYVGLGPAAHSFYNGRRFYYPRDLVGFLQNPQKTVFDGDGGNAEEKIAMALRLTEGIAINELKRLIGEKGTANLEKPMKDWIKNGLATEKDGRFSLTPKGFLVSNSIISRILCEL